MTFGPQSSKWSILPIRNNDDDNVIAEFTYWNNMWMWKVWWYEGKYGNEGHMILNQVGHTIQHTTEDLND